MPSVEIYCEFTLILMRVAGTSPSESVVRDVKFKTLDVEQLLQPAVLHRNDNGKNRGRCA